MLHIDHLARRLVHPGAKLQAQGELLGQLRVRLARAVARAIAERQWRVTVLLQRSRSWLPNIRELVAVSMQWVARLRSATRAALERAASNCERLSANLSHLDPAAVLERGYSVVRDASGRIVRRGANLSPGDFLDITFAEGGADARVERTRPKA
jgi:exodeoxyribonuclease VII large subunit